MAQQITGNAGGTIAAADPLHIRAVGQQTGTYVETTTATDGSYTLSGLPNDTYTLLAFCEGVVAAASGNLAIPYVFRPNRKQVTISSADATCDFPVPVKQTASLPDFEPHT